MPYQSDPQYQRLHQEIGVQHAWATWICQTQDWGDLAPQSLRPFSTRFVGDRGGDPAEDQRRESDSVWWFETGRGPCIVLTHEVQSLNETHFPWRSLHYAAGLVLNCLATGTTQPVTGYVPYPLMILLYRGQARWRDPDWRDLFHPALRSRMRDYPLDMVVFDMHHMAEEDIPPHETLRLIFDMERALTAPNDALGVLASRIRNLSAQGDIASLYGPARAQSLQASLTRFAATSVRRWAPADPPWEISDTISPEELIMIGEQVAIRYPTLEQRGERRGEQRGERRGEQRGERRGERRGEQRGIHKTQMAYVREMHGPDVAAAMENFLARLPVRPNLTFRDLNDLAAAWKNDRDLAAWWATHRSDLQDHEGVEGGDGTG